MNILIYYPYNLRSVEQQSVMELLIQKGYRVVLLTTCEEGPLHTLVRELGVITESVDREPKSKYAFYFKNLQKLYATIRRYQIDVVIAHQQKPAFIAGILSKMLPFKLFYVRHNSDEDYLSFPIKARWLNRIVNLVTTTKIAPSGIVQRFWIQKEKVKASNIYRINYGYNFLQYEKPELQEIIRIRDQYKAQLLIISIARLVPAKRHKEMFQVIKNVRDAGIDCKMICLGNGPLQEELIVLIKELGLESVVFLLGRKENILDYISAADVFMHLSTTEASNSAVKEVGLCKKPVIVCKGVGDFHEYIIDQKNSFLVSKQDPIPESTAILLAMAASSIDKEKIGEQLYNTVVNLFDIDKVASIYDQLLNSK